MSAITLKIKEKKRGMRLSSHAICLNFAPKKQTKSH